MDPVFVDPVIPAEAGISRVVPVESSVHVDMITVPVNTSENGISHPVFVVPVSVDPVIPAEAGISVPVWVVPVFIVPVIPAEAGISVPVFVFPVFVLSGGAHTSSVREIVRKTLSPCVPE